MSGGVSGWKRLPRGLPELFTDVPLPHSPGGGYIRPIRPGWGAGTRRGRGWSGQGVLLLVLLSRGGHGGPESAWGEFCAGGVGNGSFVLTIMIILTLLDDISASGDCDDFINSVFDEEIWHL